MVEHWTWWSRQKAVTLAAEWGARCSKDSRNRREANGPPACFVSPSLSAVQNPADHGPTSHTDSVHFRNTQKDAGCSSNSWNPHWVVLVPLGKIPKELRNLSESVSLPSRAGRSRRRARSAAGRSLPCRAAWPAGSPYARPPRCCPRAIFPARSPGRSPGANRPVPAAG